MKTNLQNIGKGINWMSYLWKPKGKILASLGSLASLLFTPAMPDFHQETLGLKHLYSAHVDLFQVEIPFSIVH